MLLELMQHLRRVNAISFFAPNRAALRSLRRLAEHGWDTHLSTVAGVPSLVNRGRLRSTRESFRSQSPYLHDSPAQVGVLTGEQFLGQIIAGPIGIPCRP